MIGQRSLTKVHPELEESAGHFNSMLGGFSIQVENTLMKYGKKIINHELPQQRIANMAIHLYVMAAVISRTTSILNKDDVEQSKKDYVLNLAKISLKDSRQEFVSNLKGMTSNIDKTFTEASKQVCDLDGYGLDIIDF